MTRAYNTATTQQNSGGAVPAFVAGKNTVINGGFDIWQRGTSISVSAASAPYSADRWQALAQTGQASTVSRQLTNDATNLPNIKYCARVQRNSGQTGIGDGLGIFNAFESLNSQQFAGRTVTFSFYARAGANFSGSGNVLKARMYSGTGTDENVIFGYSGLGFPVDASPVLTTTWQRFTYTAAIPTTVNEVQIGTYYVPTGTAGANDYFEVTGVQVELGSVATPFSRAGGTIQGELSACQRYYFRNKVANAYGYLGNGGSAVGTSTARTTINLPVPMRTSNFVVDYGGAITVSDGVTLTTPASITVETTSPQQSPQLVGNMSSGVLTQYRWYCFQDNNAGTAYIGLSAEL
jgi:hypothetical protein